jgi:hypothetical protein
MRFREDEWHNVCKHIRVNIAPDTWGGAEYGETMKIYCNICDKMYQFEIEIN